jgi:hypothetical protein
VSIFDLQGSGSVLQSESLGPWHLHTLRAHLPLCSNPHDVRIRKKYKRIRTEITDELYIYSYFPNAVKDKKLTPVPGETVAQIIKPYTAYLYSIVVLCLRSVYQNGK